MFSGLTMFDVCLAIFNHFHRYLKSEWFFAFKTWLTLGPRKNQPVVGVDHPDGFFKNPGESAAFYEYPWVLYLRIIAQKLLVYPLVI